MCRLVAYTGPPLPLAELVFGGTHSLYHQSWAPRELLSGSVNADGYGVAWYTGGSQGRTRQIGRIAETRPIWHDDELRATLAGIESDCAVAALRNSTPGIPVDRSGLLPLVSGQYTFALNGFVPDFRSRYMRSLRASLSDERYGQLAGASDSETLFLLALDALDRGVPMLDALVEVVERVRERVGEREAQLNMVLTDGTRVIAVRTGTASATNSLYVAERPPLAPDGVVLASEPTHPDAAVWTRIDHHASVVLEADGSYTVAPLAAP